MAKHEPLKPRGKVDPKNDWRVHRVEIVDHFTAVAWERNGLGEVRPVRGLQQPIDPDFERHVDEYYDRRNAAILAERERLTRAADARISQLRRQYQAKGRVLRWGDLARELSLDAKRADIGKPIDDKPTRRKRALPEYTEVVRLDEAPRTHADEPAGKRAECEPADDRVHERGVGE